MSTTTYAIRTTQPNLDMIQVINGGERPYIHEDRYFVFDAVTPTTTENHRVLDKADLYRMDEFLNGSITLLA